MKQLLTSALLLLVALGLSFCANPTRTTIVSPLQGDTIPENTPVLYSAYSKNDTTYIYEYPSEDSLIIAQRELAEQLEVIGEQGDWLEVKVRTTRRYPLDKVMDEEREQLERLYVQRRDVWREEELLLNETDLRKPILAYCIDGERFAEPKTVAPQEYVHIELISEEQYEEASVIRRAQQDWPWHPGTLRADRDVLVPIDTGTFLQVRSYLEGADSQETARTWAIIDSIRGIPHDSERVVSVGMFLELDGQELDCEGEAEGDSSEGDCYADEECAAEEEEGVATYYYEGEVPGTPIMVLVKADVELGELLFINRETLGSSPAYISFADFGRDLPVVSRDSSLLVGVGGRWLEMNRATLAYVRLSSTGAKTALELDFPLMEFIYEEGAASEVFMADGAIYAKVVARKVEGITCYDKPQYVRIRLN